MSIRIRHFVNDAVQSSDNSTYQLPLPESGNLHGALVKVRCTNGATAARNAGPLTVADNVRIVGNGDERFFELVPNEVEKWIETLWGKGLDLRHDEAAGAVQYVTFPILFGRDLFDTEFFLPLDRVRNPRLEIPYSPNIAADGGFATGTSTFDVQLIWSPASDRLPYAGTLITRSIKAFTSAASGDEPTDIDVNDPIRAIGVYAYENQVSDGTDITRVRLEANTGEFDLWAGDWDNLQSFDRCLFNDRILHLFKLLAQDNDVLDTRISTPLNIGIHCGTGQNVTNDTFSIAQIDTITGDRLTLDIGDADITAGAETHVTSTTDQIFYVEVEGLSPSYFGLLPYMSPDNARGYLDPKQFDKLKLILTQGGAGADVRVSVQTLKQVQLV